MNIVLLIAIFLPIAATFLVRGRRETVWLIALLISLATLALTAVLAAGYPVGQSQWATSMTSVGWMPSVAGETGEGSDVGGVRLTFVLDGLSIWLLPLTALLTTTSILIARNSINRREAAFYRLTLVLETGLLGVFAAGDLILFYVFFEATLIPLALLIGIWGSEERRRAAVKFFLFTLAGSLVMLVGLLAIVVHASSHAGALVTGFGDLMRVLADNPIPPTAQLWIFAAVFVGLAVKVPLVPLHTWLPLAHVQAPASASVLLAGVLLKIGGYAFLRIAAPLLPVAMVSLMPYLLGLAVVGIIYAGLVALAQKDMKRLIAYSSISHMGFAMGGMFSLTAVGMGGSMLVMLAHGLSAGGLFAMIGMLYERCHTREIAAVGGVWTKMPRWSTYFLALSLAALGLPGLANFSGELLSLFGIFERGWAEPTGWATAYRVMTVAAVAGVVLGAWYMLWLVQRLLFNEFRWPSRQKVHGEAFSSTPEDIGSREVAAVLPLLLVSLWIGCWPAFFLDRMTPTLDQLTAPVAKVLTEREAAS